MIWVVLRSHETLAPFDQKTENMKILRNAFENHLNHLWIFRDFTFFTTLARPRKSRNLDEEYSKTKLFFDKILKFKILILGKCQVVENKKT